jgi:hypothetical protein
MHKRGRPNQAEVAIRKALALYQRAAETFALSLLQPTVPATSGLILVHNGDG